MTNLIYKKEAFLDGGERNVFLTNIGDDNFTNLAIIDLFGMVSEYDETANIEINSNWSRSGCTGEGKIKSKYPLFEIGTYRTDCKYIDFKQDKIFNDFEIFVPIANGKKIKELLQNNYPVVVRVQEKVLMLSIYEFYEFIKNWSTNKDNELQMKVIEFEYWSFTWNEKTSDEVFYYKNKHVKGVDIIPFCSSIKRLDQQKENIKIEKCNSSILNILGVRKIQEYMNEYRNTDYDRKFCFTGKYGEIIAIYDENEEKEIIELLVNNDSIKEYHDDNQNQTYYYYHKGNKLVVESENLSYEYEMYLEDTDLLLIPIIDKVKESIKKIEEKIETDNYNKKYNELFSSDIKDILANNLDIMFTVQDSHDVGNCEPGTKKFLKQFSLKESISAKELIENENFQKMFNNYQFVRVIKNKLIKELIK